jgi:hypothetical protein
MGQVGWLNGKGTDGVASTSLLTQFPIRVKFAVTPRSGRNEAWSDGMYAGISSARCIRNIKRHFAR